MNTNVYIIMYRRHYHGRLFNCRVVSAHTSKKAALSMLESLKYGHLNNFDDVQMDKKNELKMYVTSDTMKFEYEIEILKCV